MHTRGLFLLIGSLLLASAASGQAPDDGALELSQRARSIETSTMSPFCPGKTLYDCPSPRAAEWRSDIRGWLAQGLSPSEIRGRLQAREPDFDLDGSDPGTGGALVILAFGVLAMLGIGAAVWRRGVRARAAEAHEAPEDGPDEGLEERLDAELRALDAYE